jgi:hypothetical protein
VSGNSADFTVPRNTDFREGFSTQQETDAPHRRQNGLYLLRSGRVETGPPVLMNDFTGR